MKKSVGLKRVFVLFLFLGTLSGFAQETESIQPYIDSAKKQLEIQSLDKIGDQVEREKEASVIERVRNSSTSKELNPDSDRFIEKWKRENPETQQEEGSFTEQVKSNLKPEPEGSAIQSVLDGTSDLKIKRPGEIKSAFGLRYGALLSHSFNSVSTFATFDSLYGAQYIPDFSIFYEYKPFHSEWWGSLGVFGIAGVSYFHGNGQFAATLKKPNGTDFSSSSEVKFQMFSVPVTLGFSYRFNLVRILRPYVMVGPTMTGYFESRNDNQPSAQSYSIGYTTVVGTAILLDWMSPRNAWNLYSDFMIKHYYITLDYTRSGTFTGGVSSTVQGLVAGLAFEY